MEKNGRLEDLEVQAHRRQGGTDSAGKSTFSVTPSRCGKRKPAAAVKGARRAPEDGRNPREGGMNGGEGTSAPSSPKHARRVTCLRASGVDQRLRPGEGTKEISREMRSGIIAGRQESDDS